MHLAVATPARDHVHTAFAFDLVNLVAHFVQHHPGSQITPIVMEGTLIYDQRHRIVESALKLGCDHILWIDSDMRFPCDAVDRLLSHKQPIVAANYATRRPPIRPTAHLDPAAQHPLYTKRGMDGVELVAFAGMGFMLTSIEVFKQTPMPWFMVNVAQDVPGIVEGEDVHFCRVAAQAGFPTFVDHLVSQQVRHIGAFEYTNEHATIMAQHPAPPVST